MRVRRFLLAGIILLWSTGAIVSHAVVTTNITASPLPPCPAPCGTGATPGVTTVTPNGTVYEITGGSNLFHSFGLFSVGTGDTANFINDMHLTTTNILSRVTGPTPSNIFGAIKTTDFGNANLFLINPAGVVFGPNATLDIGSSLGTPGSFHVSTADYIRFNDPSQLAVNKPRFYADLTQSSILTSFSPDAFGFLNPNPAAIAIQGSTLQVGEGQTLSIVGGNRTFMTDEGDTVPSGVTVTGGALSAPSGQINLVSVASPGEVLMPSLQYAPNVNGDSFMAMGLVNISGASLDVSGDPSGTVLIRGGQLVLDSSFITAFNGNVDAPTAVDIEMTGDVMLSNGSGIFAATVDGAGGDISVAAKTLSLTGGAIIFADSSGAGNGGKITISASDSLSISGADVFGNPSLILNLAEAGGNGGTVNISAGSVILDRGVIRSSTLASGNGGALNLQVDKNLTITNGGGIDSSGSSSAGKITINAGDTVTVSGQFDPGTPSRISVNGTGDMDITAGRFILADNARIQNLTDSEAGGSITISVNDSVAISSGSKVLLSIRDLPGGLLNVSAPTVTIDQAFLQTTTAGAGDAGTIAITAGNLSLTNGASVTSDSTVGLGRGGPIVIIASESVALSGGSVIQSNASVGGGAAGPIALTAGNISISGAGSGLLSQGRGLGNGGDISVQGNQVLLSDGATISAKSTGTGVAGNISIGKDAPVDALVMQSSSITTESAQNGGGSIEIQTGRMVQLTDSRITTSVHGGGGDAGNITIDPQFVILDPPSRILAQAFGGNGGHILIVTQVCVGCGPSNISASSTFGLSGTVDIQATISNLSESVAPLPAEIVQAAALLQARCAARLAGGTSGSFVVAGRDGLPLEPGGLLPSPLYVESPGSTRLARALDVPGLRVGRTFLESSLTLAPLGTGCSS